MAKPGYDKSKDQIFWAKRVDIDGKMMEVFACAYDGGDVKIGCRRIEVDAATNTEKGFPLNRLRPAEFEAAYQIMKENLK